MPGKCRHGYPMQINTELPIVNEGRVTVWQTQNESDVFGVLNNSDRKMNQEFSYVKKLNNKTKQRSNPFRFD